MLKKKDINTDDVNGRKIKTNDWLNQTDPIRIEIYHILPFIKLLIIVLMTYLIVLTFTECSYFIRDFKNDTYGYNIKPKGGIKDLWQYPKKTINVVGVDVKNFGFKNQTNTLKSFAADANVTEEL